MLIVVFNWTQYWNSFWEWSGAIRDQDSKSTIQDLPKARRDLLESIQGQKCGQSSISPRPNVSSKLDRRVIRSRGGFIWSNHICSQCVLGISQGWPAVHHKRLCQTKILKLWFNFFHPTLFHIKLNEDWPVEY